MHCICDFCGKAFFYIRGAGNTQHTCASCRVNMRRFKLRGKIVDYLGGKCSRCGYSKCFGALNVHHTDPDKKSFSISGMHCKSWTKIEAELKKCELLCSNCHREHHHDCAKYFCKSGGVELNHRVTSTLSTFYKNEGIPPESIC